MIVNDDPESIRQGVDYWLKNPPDRKRIRRKVLSQINGYRYIYSRKISKLQQQHGAHAERPERIFFDIFLNPVSKSRRYHAPDSQVTEKELSRLLAYPETEIIFKESKRDQLSFNYLVWKNKFSFSYLPGNPYKGNPWFYFIGNNRKNYTKKLIEYKIKKLFNRV